MRTCKPKKPAVMILLLILAFFIPLLSPGGAYSATINVASMVDSDSSGTACTLRDAISRITNFGSDGYGCTATGAAYGTADTVTVPTGTYTLGASGGPSLSKAIIINGNGSANTVIDANGGAFRVFSTSGSGDITLNDIAIQGGNNNGLFGTGIIHSGTGTLTISNSLIQINIAGNGGGIYVNLGPLVLTNSTVTSNTATNGAGIYNANTATITGSNITSNTGSGLYTKSGATTNIGTTNVTGNTTDCVTAGTLNDNGGNTDSDGTCFPSVTAPTVTINAHTGITQTGATLNGNVNDNGADTTPTFDYGTSPSYGSSITATPNPVTAGSGATAVSASLTGLTCGTNYYYRAQGVNSAGTTSSGSSFFGTLACPVTVPSVTTDPAGNLGQTGATLKGTVNDNNATTTVTFNYGLTTGYGTTVTATQSPLASGSGSTAVSKAITGLACGTLYHYQAVGVNSAGTTNGSDTTFTTAGCSAPIVTTDPASGVGLDNATLNGTVDDNGASTVATFEYGTTIGYGTTVTADQSPVAGGSGATAVSKAITGLACGTTFHYKAVGVNSGGTTSGADATFTTTACPINSYTLDVTVSGDGGGSVNGSGINCPGTCTATVAAGTAVTLDVSTQESPLSELTAWGGACNGASTSSNCTFTMDSNKSATAEFGLVETTGDNGDGGGTGDGGGVGDGGAAGGSGSPALNQPPDGASTGTEVTFEYTDPNAEGSTLDLYVCENEDFSGCDAPSSRVIGAGGLAALGGLMMFGFAFIGRRKVQYMMVVLALSGAMMVSACGNSSSSDGTDSTGAASSEVVTSTTLSFEPNTTYYWKVVATDSDGNVTVSETRTFTTGS